MRIQPAGSASRGFTLVELMAVSAIVAAVATLAIPRIHDSVEKAKVARAIGDIRAIASDLDAQDSLPDNLGGIGRAGLVDPWGNGYAYLKFDKTKGVPTGARRDRFLVPINSGYDLYSMGADGDTKAPLNSKASLDDVVRAMDGGFVGLASKF